MAARVVELAPARPDDLERFLEVAPDRSTHAGGESDAVTRFLAGEAPLSDGVDRLLLVAANGHDVARCAAFLSRPWQRRHREPTGFIGFIAGEHDQGEAIGALLARAEQWLAERRATRVATPFNGTEVLGAGVHTLASDESATSPRVPVEQHWIECLLAAGYRSLYPWWSYRMEAAPSGRQQAVRGVFYAKALEEKLT